MLRGLLPDLQSRASIYAPASNFVQPLQKCLSSSLMNLVIEVVLELKLHKSVADGFNSVWWGDHAFHSLRAPRTQ